MQPASSKATVPEQSTPPRRRRPELGNAGRARIMADNLIISTPSAYQYPLLIRQILETGVTRAPEQVIVNGDRERQTYRQLHERVGRLASGLAGLGIKVG